MTAVTASVLTSEGTTSTSYTNLTTTTDSVDVTVGASGAVLVCVNAKVTPTSVTGYASYDISGANTNSASDSKSVSASAGTYSVPGFGAFFLETGLSAGSTTFKMKYRSSNASYTQNFSNRYITAVPLEDLTNRTAAAAFVSTSQSTASTTYTDLTTTTDTVTVTIGPSGAALVFTYCLLAGIAAGATTAPCCSYALSGATTRSADDDHAIISGSLSNKGLGGCFLETGLGAGATTFKMKYKIAAGATSRAFANRRIAVIPL